MPKDMNMFVLKKKTFWRKLRRQTQIYSPRGDNDFFLRISKERNPIWAINNRSSRLALS